MCSVVHLAVWFRTHNLTVCSVVHLAVWFRIPRYFICEFLVEFMVTKNYII
jgi:hypothetical protein